MAELLFEILIKNILVLPGAFVRWSFKGFKGTLKQLLEKSDWTTNSIIGGALVGTVVIIMVNYHF